MKAPLPLGQSIVRREDARLLTGRGRSTDDTVPTGTAAVLFVRSPHAHARLDRIDAGAAAAAPGVLAVYTGRDLEADGVGHLPTVSEIRDMAAPRPPPPILATAAAAARPATSRPPAAHRS